MMTDSGVQLGITIAREFDRLSHQIETLSLHFDRKLAALMADFTALIQEVTDLKTVQDSAVALITGVTAQLQALIDANTTEPAQIQAIVDDLKANAQPLADAVAAGTPPAV